MYNGFVGNTPEENLDNRRVDAGGNVARVVVEVAASSDASSAVKADRSAKDGSAPDTASSSAAFSTAVAKQNPQPSKPGEGAYAPTLLQTASTNTGRPEKQTAGNDPGPLWITPGPVGGPATLPVPHSPVPGDKHGSGATDPNATQGSSQANHFAANPAASNPLISTETPSNANAESAAENNGSKVTSLLGSGATTASSGASHGWTAVATTSQQDPNNGATRRAPLSSDPGPNSATVAPAILQTGIAAQVTQGAREAAPSSPGTTSKPDGKGTLDQSNGSLPARELPELAATPTTGPVQAAQIVTKAAQSEMRMGLSTSAFGNVEVRTVIHGNEVGLAIASEKGDLRSLLTSELPSITNHLQQHNLRLNEINFHRPELAFSSDTPSGRNSQSGRYIPNPNLRVPSSEETAPESTTLVDVGETSSGISILA